MRYSMGRLVFIAAVLGLLGACTTQTSSNPVNRTFALQCPDAPYLVFHQEDDIGWLFAQNTHRLTQQSEDYFTGDGQRLAIGDNTFILNDQTCTNNPAAAQWEHAKLNGANFRGMGNEPPWILELYPGQLVLLKGYDKQRTEQPYSYENSTFTTKDYRVTLSLGPCHDSMSGKEFETKILLETPEGIFHGCGRALH